MATREENLKKINMELEMLSDEELEQVAGGSWWDTVCDYASEAVQTAEQVASEAVSAVEQGAGEVVGAIEQGAEAAGSAISSGTDAACKAITSALDYASNSIEKSGKKLCRFNAPVGCM